MLLFFKENLGREFGKEFKQPIAVNQQIKVSKSCKKALRVLINALMLAT